MVEVRCPGLTADSEDAAIALDVVDKLRTLARQAFGLGD